MLQTIKSLVEKTLGCHIYRHTLPRGTDLFADIDKLCGCDNFRVVFDIGANVGQSALQYLARFPRADVFSFEPVPAVYQRLQARLRGQPRAHPHPFGFGRAPAEVLINIDPAFDTTSSILHPRAGESREKIRLETVAGFCREQGLDAIDFLKTDTEGYEIEVLQGAAPLLEAQKIGLLLVECSLPPVKDPLVPLTVICDFLAPYRYQLFGLYDQQAFWDNRRALWYLNALFINSKLVDSSSCPANYRL